MDICSVIGTNLPEYCTVYGYYHLKIKILKDQPEETQQYLREYYEKLATLSTEYTSQNSGVDLIFPQDVYCNSNVVTKCNLGIACQMTTIIPNVSNKSYSAYDLVARSSIVNTPLMLANAVGIIDQNYRGPIISCFRSFEEYQITKGTRLVQIVAPNRFPITVTVLKDNEELMTTERGDKGFGSTGK